jgi:quercetin dioxygenase-like cupin family protein
VDVVAAQVVLPCPDIDAALAFFVDELGFRVEQISPADDPVAATISGFGARLRLDRRVTGAPGVLRLSCRDANGERVLTAPNGTVVEIVAADPPLVLPPIDPALVVSHASDAAAWVVGRARMEYRDLDPTRQGGRVIASHIRIPDGGPVPDYVHYHRVRFQMIYCARGWVKVVYEDQGEAFVMHAGDCVLQPPLIRHIVLEASPGLEVIEVGSPAIHDTFGDLEMTLPTTSVRPERTFSDQRFVRHVAADARWVRRDGLDVRDTGIGAATGGVASARVLRAATVDSEATWHHDGEVVLIVVLAGAATMDAGARREALGPFDSVTIPAGEPVTLRADSADLELLEVSMPAASS